MRRFAAVAAVVLVAALACAAIAQVAQGPQGPRTGRSEAGRERTFDPDQMIDRMAQSLGLTDAEKAATKKAMTAKRTASTALGEQLRALSEVARNEKATNKQLQDALQRYQSALATYRQKVAAIDAQLSKGLSLKARAGLTAMGIIDNGLGPRFGGGPGRPGARSAGQGPRQ